MRGRSRMSFGMQFCPPEPGDRRPKLTPYRLVCCAACFVTKQVVGNADRGDDCPDSARALHQGLKTIKEIARDLKVSRNTVRKVLRSGETSFEYERVVQPRPKLGRWAAELEGLLAGNAAKSAREQLTLIRIFEELRGRGYDGGYDAVRRYARRWSKERGESTAAAYVPLSFAPGEAYQFDWSHEVVLLNGVTVIVK